MFIPQSQAMKRASSATQTTQSASQTYLDSATVVSAISKLNDTIVVLKKKVSSQQTSVAVLALFFLVLLVICLLGGVAICIRYQNRVRASQGIEPIANTRWLMAPMGPSLNSTVSVPSPNNNNNITTTTQMTQVERSQPQDWENPYTCETTSSANFPNNPHRSMSEDTLAGEDPPNASKIDILHTESCPRNIDDFDKNTLTDASLGTSSPNVNRYTIDIEFDPYNQQVENYEEAYLPPENYPVNDEDYGNYRETPDFDPFANRESSVANNRNFTHDDDEYEDNFMAPKKFLTVSTGPRQSVASSVYTRVQGPSYKNGF